VTSHQRVSSPSYECTKLEKPFCTGQFYSLCIHSRNSTTLGKRLYLCRRVFIDWITFFYLLFVFIFIMYTQCNLTSRHNKSTYMGLVKRKYEQFEWRSHPLTTLSCLDNMNTYFKVISSSALGFFFKYWIIRYYWLVQHKQSSYNCGILEILL